MTSFYTHGVRTTAHANAWVQTGFTLAQAEAEAERLNALGTIPGAVYVAAPIAGAALPTRNEYTFANEDSAKGLRRTLINTGANASLIVFDPARNLYVFDA